MATDGLVHWHQAISSHSAEHTPMRFQLFMGVEKNNCYKEVWLYLQSTTPLQYTGYSAAVSAKYVSLPDMSDVCLMFTMQFYNGLHSIVRHFTTAFRIQWCSAVITILNSLQNPHKRHSIARLLGWATGCVLGGSIPDLYSASLTAVMYVMSCYIRPHYDGTQMYCADDNQAV